MAIKLFISMLSVKCFNYQVIIKSLEPFVAGFHLDAMDDHFVDNLALSPDMIQEIRNCTKKTVWLHLMVNNPEKWLERVSILEKNDRVTIHYEVLLRMPFNKQLEILHKFNKKNLNVGIALNPETAMPDSNLLLMNIEHVLIMSVKPGFSGQVFIESTKEKIKKIIKNKTEKGYLYRIAIDGGITKELYDELKQYPVDDFVLGAALFSDKKNPKKELEKFL